MGYVTKAAIKRACFEWLTIGLASATAMLFAFWVASLTSSHADFAIQLARNEEVSSADGSITFKKGMYNIRYSLLFPTLFLASLTLGSYLPYRRAVKTWQAELGPKRD